MASKPTNGETPERPYQPEDALGNALTATLIVGGAGLLTSAVQASLARENVGAFGLFSRFGTSTTSFGMGYRLSFG